MDDSTLDGVDAVYPAERPLDTSARAIRVLMVATIFRLPYRVLRCARAVGADVFVLGNAGARGLRLSRHCSGFVLSDRIVHGGRDKALALEINSLVRELGIAMVMPGDAPSTRTLIANRDLIEAPCFPLPALDQFDALNDKWQFARLCTELSIRHPPTRLLGDVAALAREISLDAIEFPVVAKPLNRTGGDGIVALDGTDTIARLKTINYEPILVQQFVPGQDIGASLYARDGKVEAFIAHRLWHQVYSVLEPGSIYADVEKIVRHLELDGVYNFDMRLAPDRSVHFLECNPRFFFKMHLSMIAGINFVERGLPHTQAGGAPPLPEGAVRLPKGLLFSLATTGRSTRRDWAMARYLYSDPLPYWMEQLGLAV